MFKLNKTAIYTLEDKDGHVRYVGKSKNPKKRYDSYIYPASNNRTPVIQWCKKLKRNGLRPMMKVIDLVDDWEKAEKEWISHYKQAGCRLLNISPGGLDMFHVKAFKNKMPAYCFAMRMCGRIKNKKLSDLLRLRRREAENKGQISLIAFDNMIRETILKQAPLARISAC